MRQNRAPLSWCLGALLALSGCPRKSAEFGNATKLYELGQHEQAVALVEKVLADSPEDAEAGPYVYLPGPTACFRWRTASNMESSAAPPTTSGCAVDKGARGVLGYT